MKTITIILVAIFSIGQAHSQISYSLNIKKGDEFQFALYEMDEVIEDFMGMENKTQIESEFLSTIKVEEVSGNEITLVQTYDSFSLKAICKALDIDLQANSNDASTNQSLNGIVGKSIKVKLTNGIVTSVEGLDEIQDVLSEDFEMSVQFYDSFMEEDVRSIYEKTFLGVDGNKYTNGVTWKTSNTADDGMTILYDYTPTVVSHTAFEFEFNSTVDFEIEDKAVDDSSVKITKKGAFSGSGKMNTETGLLNAYQMQGKMEIETFMESFNMTVPQTIHQKMSFTLK